MRAPDPASRCKEHPSEFFGTTTFDNSSTFWPLPSFCRFKFDVLTFPISESWVDECILEFYLIRVRGGGVPHLLMPVSRVRYDNLKSEFDCIRSTGCWLHKISWCEPHEYTPSHSLLLVPCGAFLVWLSVLLLPEGPIV